MDVAENRGEIASLPAFLIARGAAAVEEPKWDNQHKLCAAAITTDPGLDINNQFCSLNRNLRVPPPLIRVWRDDRGYVRRVF